MKQPVDLSEPQIFAIERSAPQLLTAYFIFSLALGPLFFILFIPLFIRYHTLRYRFDSEGIHKRWGILFRREINLTYARIQDIHLLESLGLLLFVVQLPVTYLLVRLDYELRWYIVTDRSLRIREGIFRINELTLISANVQDVSIRQNPMQRLLGISDLRVQTAGGGGSGLKRGPGLHRQEESGHIGYFHGLDDAEAQALRRAASTTSPAQHPDTVR